MNGNANTRLSFLFKAQYYRVLLSIEVREPDTIVSVLNAASILVILQRRIKYTLRL